MMIDLKKKIEWNLKILQFSLTIKKIIKIELINFFKN